MSALWQQLLTTLRLHFRNRMGLIYGYIFPAVFLAAFWVLYRYETPPLVRHMGELLTVAVLGGACFGLPTTLVSERERGVWRRYRLAPVRTGSLVASTVAARYLILLTAGLLQLALAMLVGMPAPLHPLQLWVAFTFVSFAFLGLGLVIAVLADNVPAVQALGQVVFLPMLVIGGVAVPLRRLPDWAQHLSAFFPGRYAVQAMQECVNGAGLRAAGFGLLALLLIGVAGCVAGARLFRWDAQQRFAVREGGGWLAVAVAAWVAVGLLAEARGGVTFAAAPETDTGTPPPVAPGAVATAPGPVAPRTAARPDSGLPARPSARKDSSAAPPAAPPAAPVAAPAGSTAVASAPAGGDTTAATRPAPAAPPASWREVDVASIDDRLFHFLPADEGVEAPYATAREQPGQVSTMKALDCIQNNLTEWAPAKISDPVQRVRNLILVAVVPDILQEDQLEPFVPRVVLDRLRKDYPREQLERILYWIATHPDEGAIDAADRVSGACVPLRGGVTDRALLRERTGIYARKMLGRVTGRIAE